MMVLQVNGEIGRKKKKKKKKKMKEEFSKWKQTETEKTVQNL